MTLNEVLNQARADLPFRHDLATLESVTQEGINRSSGLFYALFLEVIKYVNTNESNEVSIYELIYDAQMSINPLHGSDEF